MSHYRVAVFANDPSEFEALLAPYNEADENYFEHVPLGEPSEYLRKRYNELVEKGVETLPFEEWLEEIGYEVRDGKICSFFNPHGKWDWYTLGGGDWQFDLKPGEELDENGNGRKNQFSYVNHEYKESDYRKIWDTNLRDAAESTDANVRRSAELFLKMYPDKNVYVSRCMIEHPYAFITPDGVWHAPGTVGWFGVSDDTSESYEKYLDEWTAYINSPENPYVNFVDCHI